MADGEDNFASSAQPLGSLREGMKLVAALQAKVDILRRAQAMGPQLADELQIEIAQIERDLRALGRDALERSRNSTHPRRESSI
jgi:hypothetical protein